MTRLSAAKKVRRLVSTESWGDLVVELAPAGLLIREKGRRFTIGPISYGSLYQRGVVAFLEGKTKKRKRGMKR